MHYQIRVARPNDAKGIYGFICLLEETRFDYALFEAIFYSNCTNNNYYYLVAEAADGQLLGFISCHTQYLLHHCGRVGEIQELYTDERFRKMGIGKKLLTGIEDLLVLNQCSILEVTAQNKRSATHRFYETAGFSLTHKKFVKSLATADTL